MEQLRSVREWQTRAGADDRHSFGTVGRQAKRTDPKVPRVRGKRPGGGISEEPPPTVKQVVIGDTEFAEQVFSERRVGVAGERTYTLSEVEEAVCQMMRIGRQELMRPQRTPAVKRARELFMYLGRRHTGASLREIADRLGVRDISTVSHGEKRVTNSLREKSAEAKELTRVLNKTYSLIQA